MSTGLASDQEAIQAYYDYLKETADIVRTLTERLIYMEEIGLASSANLMRDQLGQMLDASIESQIANIPQPSFDGS